ncbi:MAG: hypothetical protein MUC36_23440 [Planctomycetes bacterium]|jgi:YHS domain-containing protein|nr:hypothetical protein [Planctomycetota bacterium]
MRAFAAVVLAAVFAAAVPGQEPAPTPQPGGSGKVDFRTDIAPILVARCVECHGPKEQKGDLRLDARIHLFPEGGEDGWSVTPAKPDDSELLRRLALPPDDDEVMPAKGEPLTKAQQDLFRRWVAEGAEWPAAGDEWIAAELAAQVLPKITFDLPELDAAGEAAIDTAVQALRQLGAVVQPVASDTKALDVNLSLLRDQVGDAQVALLAPLAPRLVWLNLSRTAVSDAGAEVLAQLGELRRLHAANTALGDAAIERLRGLGKLEYLNLYGTKVGDDGLAGLAALGKLQRLYVWQTRATAAGATALRGKLPQLQVDLGDYVEARLEAAQKEIAERTERQKPINDVCPVADKPVDPAQTIEHEGRRIGFCCAKCKAAFQKEPAKFLAKLPAK